MSYLTNLFGIGISIFLLGCSATLPVKNTDASDFLTGAIDVLAQFSRARTSGQVLPISARVWVADRPIELEVAETAEQQDIGLMYRTSLPDNRGMLFKFKSARRVSFWMKNCQISLDMIFLRGGVVEAIQLSAPPCTAEPCPTYGPDTAVDQVIELRGGRAAELGVKVGDRIKIEFLPL